MKLRYSILVLCCAVSVPVAAQKSPSAVTDAQISHYKAAAEQACRDSGKKAGDPDEKVQSFCKCMTGVFEKSLTKKEWQQAVFFSTQDRAADERNVLGPHMTKLRTCAQPPAAKPAAGKPDAKPAAKP